MHRRLPFALRLALPLTLLAACQSSPQAPPPLADRGSDPAWIETELARAIRLVDQPAAADSASVDGLSTAIAALGARLDQLSALTAALPSQGSEAKTTNASYAAPAETEAGEIDSEPGDPAIHALTHSLNVLDSHRAALSGNIANAFIPGYKRRSIGLTTTLDAGSGVQVPAESGIQLSMLQGVLELTGNQLDFGIEGAGFFEIMKPDGTLFYTRSGMFRQDFNGRIITAEGYLLTEPICIPPDCQGISISRDGQVFGQLDDHQLEQLAQLRLHVFTNPEALQPVGSAGFTPTSKSGRAFPRQPGVQGTGTVAQGYIERSNVNLTDELVRLQLVHRHRAAVRQALAVQGIFTP